MFENKCFGWLGFRDGNSQLAADGSVTTTQRNDLDGCIAYFLREPIPRRPLQQAPIGRQLLRSCDCIDVGP